MKIEFLTNKIKKLSNGKDKQLPSMKAENLLIKKVTLTKQR